MLLASTNLQEEPTNQCKRWSKTEKKFKQVKRPNMMLKYNDSMGDIEMIDRMISYY